VKTELQWLKGLCALLRGCEYTDTYTPRDIMVQRSKEHNWLTASPIVTTKYYRENQTWLFQRDHQTLG